MKRALHLWVIGVTTAFLAGQLLAFDLNSLDVNKVVSGSKKLVKATQGLTDNEEIQIGREVAAAMAAKYGFVEDEASVHYVNLVGQTLIRQCERKKIPYHFAILRVSEINAMAAPGGYVFITQGLLDSLKDEAELAGVLAHEVSHVTRQHIVKAIRQANLLEAGEDLVSATGHDVERYGKLGDFSVDLLSKGLSREDELEADKQGTLLAARVGYDATGLRRSIESLKSKAKSDLLLAHFNKTHPRPEERLETIDQLMKAHALDSNGRRNPERFVKHR